MRNKTYVLYGKPLKVGDKVTIRVTLRESKKDQIIEGWVQSLPPFDDPAFCIQLSKGESTVTIYPLAEDIQGLSVKAVPANWPPQEDDVWSGRNHTWHFLGGNFVTGTMLVRKYTAEELNEFLDNNKTTELLFRKS